MEAWKKIKQGDFFSLCTVFNTASSDAPQIPLCLNPELLRLRHRQSDAQTARSHPPQIGEKLGGKSCVNLPLTFSKDPFVGCLHPFLSICVNGVSLELLSTEVCVYCCSWVHTPCTISPPQIGHLFFQKKFNTLLSYFAYQHEQLWVRDVTHSTVTSGVTLRSLIWDYRVLVWQSLY